MTFSSNLQLPYLLPSQADKHVSYNQAIERLDGLVQMKLNSTTQETPPSAIAGEGEAWSIGAAPSGAWANQAGKIAKWKMGEWTFETAQIGWVAWVEDRGVLCTFDGQIWQPITRSVPVLGVNTIADATNKLAVKSNAVLLSHDEAGTGDVRIIVNKAATNNIASLLFQTAWSGRSEFSVGADDALTIRTSQNGTLWNDAIRINPSDGRVKLTLEQPSALAINLLADAGRFAGVPEPTGIFAPAYTAPTYWAPYNGAVFSQGPKFIYDSASYNGAAAALDAKVVSLIDRIRSTVPDKTFGRFGIEFFTLQAVAGSGTAYPIVSDGITHYLAMTNQQAPIPATLTIRTQILVVSGSVFLANAAPNCELFIDGNPIPSGQMRIAPGDGWKEMTRIWSHPTRTSFGYEPTLWKLWASAGAVFLLAVPAVMAGRAQPQSGELEGVLPSFNAWRL